MKSSPSRAMKFDTCPRQYQYQYIWGWRRRLTPDTLVFGKVIDTAARLYLLAQADGRQEDPAARFESLWREKTRSEQIEYRAKRDADSLMAIGIALMEKLAAWWPQSGYQVAVDKDGRPIVQRAIVADLGRGIEHMVIIDLMVVDPAGRFGVWDIKTAAREPPEEWLEHSEQLLDYAMIAQAAHAELGVPVDEIRYLHLLKRVIPKKSKGKGPELVLSKALPMPDDQAKNERVEKLRWQQNIIRQGLFPKAPRMSFNSPCSMCDFAIHCIHGRTEGLSLPNKQVAESPEDIELV
jgi:hypothetical protein